MTEAKNTITLGVHLSLTDEPPVLVGSVDVPITLTLAPAPGNNGKPIANLAVNADIDEFRERLTQALHTFADTLTITRPQTAGAFTDLFHR